MKVHEIPEVPAKFLITGKPGTGKTLLAMTGGEKVQIIDLDRGYLSGITWKDQFTEARSKVDIIPCYEKEPDKAVAFRLAKEHLYNVANACVKGTYPYTVLCIDGLTTWGDGAMRMIRVNSSKWGVAPQLDVKKGVTQPEWGLAINELEQCLSIIRSLPIAVIVLAHITETDDKYHPENPTQLIKVGGTEIGALGQKIPDKIGAYFDEVYYAATDVVAGGRLTYKLYTKQTARIKYLKTRAQVPDGTLLDTGLPGLLKLARYDINKGGIVTAPPVQT